ncbi:MAG TPA: type IV toxin-antitoxin system AbiEi family antitoxin domain-containing protein [Solirubrobacteraceae bacterium]
MGSETPISGTRDERIFAVAAAQRGRISRRQMLDAGVASNTIDRLASSGWLRRKHRGVFAVGPDVPIPLADETAALLAVRPGAALSHHTAAALWGLRAADSGDGLIHVTVPGASVDDPTGVRVHRSRILVAADVWVRERLPVTSPARVLLDVAAVSAERDLERALDQMLIQRLAGLAHVRELLARAGRHAGRAIVQDLLDAYTTTTFTRSKAEEVFLELVTRARLPRPLTNARRHGHEIDFLWPDERVAVEIDGFAYHSTRDRFERDRRRDAALRRAGITVIRVTWRQLEREPMAVLVDVAQALARTAR